MATAFYDAFSGTSGATLNSRTSNSGHTWLVHLPGSATPVAEYRINASGDGVLGTRAGSTRYADVVGVLMPANATIDVTFLTPAWTGSWFLEVGGWDGNDARTAIRVRHSGGSGTTLRAYTSEFVNTLLATFSGDPSPLASTSTLSITPSAVVLNGTSYAYTGLLAGSTIYLRAYTSVGSSVDQTMFPQIMDMLVSGDAPASAPFTGVASGFSSTTFGTPVCSINVLALATGFSSIIFSTPYARFSQFCGAAGFTVTSFGAPSGYKPYSAESWPPNTYFGTPATAFNQTQLVSGFCYTPFGTPFGFRYANAPIGRLTQAYGFGAALLGAPAAHWLQVGNASGAYSSSFGTPKRASAQAANGFEGTVLGTATVRIKQPTTGACATTLGTPTARVIQPTVSTYRPTRFGLPTTLRSNTFMAGGLPRGKFGQPTGFSRFNYPAAGFTGTQLGAPTCHQRHRVSNPPLGTRFGQPLLKRALTC